MKVKANLDRINHKIQLACDRVGRDVNSVKIIAVTKYVSIERTKEAFDEGIMDFGENRDEGLIKKWSELGDELRWHYIGSLQTRKVKSIIDKVSYIHSLDRLSLAEEINKRANFPINCLIQVNVSEEESKHGLKQEELLGFIQQLEQYQNIRVVGLMTMAPLTKDKTIVRNCFSALKRKQEEVIQLQLAYAPCEELSMGMSNDFEIAVEEGATFVRIGTALVG
jgi:pyridoxal phosphate enzyme (YggS family)